MTVLVVGFLVIAGPASAVKLKIQSSTTTPYEGQVIDFTAQLDVEENERVPVEKMTVVVKDSNGNVHSQCSFTPAGTMISNECDTNFQSITAVNTGFDYQNPAVGFGYGYGYDGSVYGWDTTNFGYGYGYMAGYGYNSAAGSDFEYTVKWKAPYVSSTQSYTVSMSAIASDGTESFTYMTTEDVSLNVYDLGSGSSNKDKDETPGDGETQTPENTEDTEDNTQEDNTVVETKTPETNNEIESVKNAIVQKLNIAAEDIESVVELRSETLEEVGEVSEEEINSLDEPIRAAIEKELASGNKINSKSKSSVKVYEVTKKDGTKQKVVKITREVEVDLANVPADKKTIRVVEVIPKEVAASAASQIVGNFEILEDDPVIAFDVPVSSIVGNKVSLEYYVLSETADQFASGIKAIVVTKDEPMVDTATPTTQTGDGETSTEDASSSSNVGLIVFLGLVIAVIIGVAVYFVMKK